MRSISLSGLAFATLLTASAQQDPARFEQAAARIREHIRVLSSDEFEGRAPGSAGEEKSVAYLQAEFQKLGLEPGNPDGTFVQSVPMVGILSHPTVSFRFGATRLVPTAVNDFVVSSRVPEPLVRVKDSPVVFIGYGVVAPEYGWDDFKGVDVRGKTVVVLINDPPVRDPKDPSRLDETMFKGKAMTYYGRWTYKFEEAAAKGAAACLIVHETGPAGYPFAVVTGSWGRESFGLVDPAGGNALKVQGWLTLDFARRLFAAAGKDFDALKAAAVRPDFRPVEFPSTADFSIGNSIRPLASRNVIAKLEGSDPARKGEYVVVSAHWDHLGKNPRLKGDPVFHGAADDASGCAAMLEIAREFVQLPPSERPPRSILFIGFTAEEQGLVGAEYYCKHPLYPLERTLADINLDGTGGMQPAGPARNIEVVGFGSSTLDDDAAAIVAREGRHLTPESNPEKGFYYRADSFEFAKAGVPSFYEAPGLEIIGKPEGYGAMRRAEYIADDYHKPTDVIKPWWDLRGAAEDSDVLFQLALVTARAERWPAWKPGNEFKERREAMLGRAAK